MSYGTRGPRRKPSQDDPTVIPSTQPIGFLGKLPWKIGGTLRYKPSAADLQEHPGHHEAADENAPLLGSDTDDYYPYDPHTSRRKRSGTTGSGDTSDSYRSRGDLFPSDGEEDAVPLDDEFTLPLDRVDDRSSNRTRSSKGKRPAGSRPISRTVSRTTVASGHSGFSSIRRRSTDSLNGGPVTPSIHDLRFEEERIAREEDEEIEKKRNAAAQLAQKKGLAAGEDISTSPDARRDLAPTLDVEAIPEVEEPAMSDEHEEGPKVETEEAEPPQNAAGSQDGEEREEPEAHPKSPPDGEFIPARLPMFR